MQTPSQAYDELLKQLNTPSVIVLPAFEASNLTRWSAREQLVKEAVQRKLRDRED
jgi:hypothetical protein